MKAIRLAALAIVLFAGVTAFAQDANSIEGQVRARIDAMRAVVAAPNEARNQARVDAITKQMDDTWQFFDSNRAKALPVLRRELAAEARRPGRNPFVLLGVGFYLYTHGDKVDREPAKAALFEIDSTAPIIRWNYEQYFYFVHSVAAEHDERILPLIDAAFLDKGAPLVIPEYALNLDEGLVCVMLYGAYGAGAEQHLVALLQNPARVRRAIEVLVWIGSPASNAAVVQAMKANPNLETFARGTAFLMQSGGPEGRDILLNMDPKQLDPQSADALSKSRTHIETVSYAWYKSIVDRMPGVATMPDAELRKRLQAAASGRAQNEALSPRAIFASAIPRDELIAGLTGARDAMLQHVYDQVLQDVRTTDMMINGLRYRDH